MNDTLKQNSSYFSDTATLIETKEQVKDLGVTLDINMTYNQHIQDQIQKVKNISAWIYQTFKSRKVDLMLMENIMKNMEIFGNPTLRLLLSTLVA